MRSRANAITHGCTATVVLDDELRETIDRREAEWTAVEGRYEGRKAWAFREAVVASVLIDRCRTELQRQIATDAAHALGTWDLDRRAEVEALGAKLNTNPVRIAAELRRTRYGAEWLLERIEALHAFATHQNTLDEDQRTLALDLLGTDEMFRIDPTTHAPISLAQLTERLDEARANLRHRLDEVLIPLDDLDRARAEAGEPSEPSRAVRRLHRYEAAQRRRYERSVKEFESSSTPSRPAPAPRKPSARPAPSRPVAGNGDLVQSLDSLSDAEFEAFLEQVESAPERPSLPRPPASTSPPAPRL